MADEGGVKADPIAVARQRATASQRWLRTTATHRKIFLHVLAESYDCDAAMAAAGLSWPDVCELRARYPDFALRIEEVVVAGFDRLDASLLRAAIEALNAEKPNMALVQAVMKLRRPARAANPVGKPNAAERAAREKLIRSIMSRMAPQTARGGRGDGKAKAKRTGKRAAGDDAAGGAGGNRAARAAAA